MVVLDSQASAIPEHDVAAVVSASDEGLAIGVHHAQDVEFEDLAPEELVPKAEVAVEVYVDEPLPRTPAFEAVLSVPSGTLMVGDADQEDTLEIGPGLWGITVICTPWDHADKVELWLHLVE
jgi:hypothetical protein